MIRQILSGVGRMFVRRAVANGVISAGGHTIDPKFGLRLMRDHRVPMKAKVMALAFGAGAILVLQALELPFQAAIALLVPVFGLAGDMALDGVEMLAGPLLVATLMLPYLAPREIVEQIRTEGDGRVYEAARVK